MQNYKTYPYIYINRFIFFLVISLLLFLGEKNSYGQEFPSYMVESEIQLKELYDSLFANDSIKFYQPDTLKDRLNEEIITIFNEILEDPASFLYPFSILNRIGVRYSQDKLVKIYTWNIKYSDGKYKYFGYIQYNYKKKKEILTYFLQDKIELNDSIMNISLRDTNWYGALYYKVIQNKFNGKKFYTLFGWDGNDYLTTKKIIDVLYFTKSGKPRFGKSIFKLNRQRSKRLVFEYSEKSVMSISYDNKLNMIIYDYLAPQSSSLKGQYSFYGPDGTYDGLYFTGGKWKHYSDIDIEKIKNTNYTSGKPQKGTFVPKRIYNPN